MSEFYLYTATADRVLKGPPDVRWGNLKVVQRCTHIHIHTITPVARPIPYPHRTTQMADGRSCDVSNESTLHQDRTVVAFERGRSGGPPTKCSPSAGSDQQACHASKTVTAGPTPCVRTVHAQLRRRRADCFTCFFFLTLPTSVAEVVSSTLQKSRLRV